MYVKPSLPGLEPGDHMTFTIKSISFSENPINTTNSPEKCTFDHTLKILHTISEGIGAFQRATEPGVKDKCLKETDGFPGQQDLTITR